MNEKNKLREEREKSGLTQKQVAAAVGIDVRNYQYYELGRVPSAKTAVKIARALNTTVEELYGD